MRCKLIVPPAFQLPSLRPALPLSIRFKYRPSVARTGNIATRLASLIRRAYPLARERCCSLLPPTATWRPRRLSDLKRESRSESHHNRILETADHAKRGVVQQRHVLHDCSMRR